MSSCSFCMLAWHTIVKEASMRTSRMLVFIVILLVAVPVVAKAEDLEVEFGDKGLSKLTYAGTDLLADGEFRITGAFFRKPDGTVYKAEEPGKLLPIAGARPAYELAYPWGAVRISPAAKEDRLNITVDVTLEQASDELVAMYLELGKLKFPKKPDFPNHSFLFYMRATVAHNLYHPGIVAANYGPAAVVACNEQIGRPLAFGFGRPEDKEQTIYPLLAYTGRHPMLKEKFPWIERRINPGGRDRWELSLRFASTGEAAARVTDDLYRRYAEVFPYQLEWPDRRPIATIHPSSAHLGTGEAGPTTNPRGWIVGAWDDPIDVTTEKGRAHFKERMMTYAVNSAKICKDMDAQGVIVWSIEGQEYPHMISYLGDPRSLPPEMVDVADEFFKAFTDAGLRTGLCIRPQRPLRSAYQPEVSQLGFAGRADRCSTLLAKIDYAKKRWGCTLFYLDSNVTWFGDPVKIPDAAGYTAGLDVETLKEITEAHPDVLIVAEWEALRSYAYAAPYSQLNYNKELAPPDNVLLAYPDAFFVNNADEKSINIHRDALVGPVKRGDILFFAGWWTSPENKIVKEIYEKAKE